MSPCPLAPSPHHPTYPHVVSAPHSLPPPAPPPTTHVELTQSHRSKPLAPQGTASLPGSILAAAACIAYAGSLPPGPRERLAVGLRQICKESPGLGIRPRAVCLTARKWAPGMTVAVPGYSTCADILVVISWTSSSRDFCQSCPDVGQNSPIWIELGQIAHIWVISTDFRSAEFSPVRPNWADVDQSWPDVGHRFTGWRALRGLDPSAICGALRPR